MKKYSASLDTFAIVITLFVSLISIALPGSLFIGHDEPQASPDVTVIIMSVILVVLFVSLFIYRVLYYTIDEQGIKIVRMVSPVLIPFSEIRAIAALSKDDMLYTMRTMGNGGFWGYTGKFTNEKIGAMTWFATRRDSYVLIRRADKNYILSPDEQEAFVEHVRTKLNQSTI